MIFQEESIKQEGAKMKRKKLKNIILMTVTLTMIILFFTSMCALDADSWIPLQVCVLSFAWLALFTYANGMWVKHE